MGGYLTQLCLKAGCGWQLTNIFLLAGLYEYHRRTVGTYIFSYFKIFRTGDYVHLPAIWSNTCGIVNILIRFCRSPTKFCLIIMMHDQLWFNSYMWRKEQDTQTNQQTHTHTSSSMHEMCLLTQYIEKFLKYSFILAKCFMIVEIFTLVSLAIVISRIIWFMIGRQLSESLWEIKT